MRDKTTQQQKEEVNTQTKRTANQKKTKNEVSDENEQKQRGKEPRKQNGKSQTTGELEA